RMGTNSCILVFENTTILRTNWIQIFIPCNSVAISAPQAPVKLKTMPAEKAYGMSRPSISRYRLIACGAVQGVGFRPFVYRLARSLNLAGFVCNTPNGALIEIEGEPAAVEEFFWRIRRELPAPALLATLEASALDPVGYKIFEILPSELSAPKT